MKKISGQLIARVLHVFRYANEVEVSKEELLSRIKAVVEREDPYCEIFDDEPPVARGTHPRLENLGRSSLETLNVLLPWSSYFVLSSNQIIGSAWTKTKRNNAQPFPDKTVVKLAKSLDLRGLSVLELGCYEGHHSISLAQFANSITAIDGRIENVLKTLVRVWAANMEEKITSNLIDLEKGNLKEKLTASGLNDKFDLIYHRGVLYHLSDPISNLFQCAEVCNRFLYLHTQYASDSNANYSLEHAGENYKYYRYKEPKIEFSPFSGMRDYAIWLSKSSLLKAIENAGFKKVTIISEVVERNGPRIELIAEK